MLEDLAHPATLRARTRDGLAARLREELDKEAALCTAQFDDGKPTKDAEKLFAFYRKSPRYAEDKDIEDAYLRYARKQFPIASACSLSP